LLDVENVPQLGSCGEFAWIASMLI